MSEQLLIQFKKELNQIRDYLFYLDKIDEIVAYIPNETDCLSTKSLLETFRKQHIVFEQDKKMFEYKAILISLYGLLEKFIEIWVKAYLDTLCTVVPYHLLPANLQNNHFKQSVSLIAIILEDRWAKYQHLTKEAIIKKLHHCAEQPTQYQLNTDAFVISSGNLKHKRIVQIFETISINLNHFLIKNTLLNEATGVSIYHQVEKEVLYAKINELVDRRNAIAHGADVDDLLERSLVNDYIDFLEKYCQAIFETLQTVLIEQETVCNYKRIEKVHGVWKHTIIGCELAQYKIQEGDFLIVQTADGAFFKRKIIEVQLNKERCPILTIVEKTDIAIRVDPSINIKCAFFLKKQL